VKNIQTVVIVVALLLILGVGAFLSPGHSFGMLDVSPTPTPYVAPVRGPEIPLTTHRAQAQIPAVTPTRFNPWGIAIDQDNGFVWVAEPGCDMAPTCPQTITTVLGKFSLADGSMLEEYLEPPGYSSPLFLAMDEDEPNGYVWFTEPNTDAIGAFDPKTTNFYQYPVQKGSAPYDLIVDKNDNIWFTEFNGNAIGFLNTKTHKVIETPVPTVNTNPYGITVDPKGNIWFAENNKNVDQIGTFTPNDNTGQVTITEYHVDATQVHLITADDNGDIWFSEAFGGNVGKFDPKTATTTNFQVTPPCLTTTCPGVHVSGIAVDANDNVWFDDSLAGTVGYVIPATGQVIKKQMADPNAHPHDGLVVDPNGTVWFTLEYGKVLNMWPGGKLPAK
jgi:virginiamycin B lyase